MIRKDLMEPKWGSETVTEQDASVIRMLLKLGFPHKRIAALFDVNQGRISEVNSGKRQPDAVPLDEIIARSKGIPGWFYTDPSA